ncbi:DMT family transporter [Nocardia harenae]|uniref:DMT family transporter n=1 Tax=Nocardia harenae TaxID=358707 RepID=UPI00082E351D|nr:DMT family transporter [Nocardia harenae]
MTGRTRIGVLLGFGIGAGVAVQARINGALGARLHDGIAAATVSFLVGLVALLLAALFDRRVRAGLHRVRAAVADRSLRPWQLLGGLCGAFFVAGQGLTVAAIGVTAFTTAAVAGQLISSLVVDRLGLAPSGRTPVTPRRLAGAVLGIGAVALAAVGQHGAPAAAVSLLPDIPPVLLVLLPALAGVGLAWQQAVNGRVGAVGGPAAAALVNFVAGLLLLVPVAAAVLAIRGLPATPPPEPWLYLGGLIGVVFIAVAAFTVRWIGVLLLGLTSVAGQLSAAVLLDVLTAPGLSTPAVAACALTLLAVLTATLTPRPH